ncbi:hypothetical protein SASPL_128407 [Salvia splendens]|uniref:Uncharacterized protein n=1 Tax=Salvia splendens TaxID=180675 RepID=A0A8X8XD34_SALSN|nr:hypothetical protein SASPL_128407 [Salvia splendens]
MIVVRTHPLVPRGIRRGRDIVTNDKDAAAPKKEAKLDVSKAVEEATKEGVERLFAVKEAEAEVDEEMEWATCWFPFWEVQAPADACEALYGDVWDYDIWGLKTVYDFPPQ